MRRPRFELVVVIFEIDMGRADAGAFSFYERLVDRPITMQGTVDGLH